MTTATLTSPGQQEIIDILKAASKGMTSREIFAKAKGFEDADAVSKALNYAMKKGVVEREKVAQNTYAYWLASHAPATPAADDSGNTLLRVGEDEPMPEISAATAKQIANDAINLPDAVTREMADQAEIAYQVLSEALGLTTEQMCDMTLTDLAAAAAARLEEQPPPADVAMLASANRAISMRMAKVIEALHKAPVSFSEAIDNDQYLVSNVEAIVAQMAGEQARARELQGVIIGLHTLLDQVRHTLDLSPAASSMDILAEIENLSRLADRATHAPAKPVPSGPYIIISDPRGAAGTYETIDEARKFAESTARRSTSGRAAIVNIVAEVALVPQWSEKE